jgi:hypothetical protein
MQQDEMDASDVQDRRPLFGEPVLDHVRRMLVLSSLLAGAWAALHFLLGIVHAEPFMSMWLQSAVIVVGTGIVVAGFIAIGVAWTGVPRRLADIDAALQRIESRARQEDQRRIEGERTEAPAREGDVAISSALPTLAAQIAASTPLDVRGRN